MSRRIKTEDPTYSLWSKDGLQVIQVMIKEDRWFLLCYFCIFPLANSKSAKKLHTISNFITPSFFFFLGVKL